MTDQEHTCGTCRYWQGPWDTGKKVCVRNSSGSYVVVTSEEEACSAWEPIEEEAAE